MIVRTEATKDELGVLVKILSRTVMQSDPSDAQATKAAGKLLMDAVATLTNPSPDGTNGGAARASNGSAANSQGGAAEGSAGDGAQALAELVTRLASKLRVVGASEKQRTAELATVANSYFNRRDELVALGRGDEALDAVRAELLSRGCGDADALLAGVAKKRGIAA